MRRVSQAVWLAAAPGYQLCRRDRVPLCDSLAMEFGLWRVGERVTTPNGFVAEIVSVAKERALIRYISTPPGSGETELPLELLRPATARDLLLAGITG